jgi:hypothetical protein
MMSTLAMSVATTLPPPASMAAGDGHAEPILGDYLQLSTPADLRREMSKE